MSMYRQGQQVVFHYPVLFVPPTNATITQVLRDSENGDERDLYLVRVDEGQASVGHTYTITNSHVVRLQTPPTPPNPEPPHIQYLDTSAFRWDVPIPAENSILDEVSDEEEAHDDESEEEEDESTEEANQSETSQETTWMTQTLNGLVEDDSLRQRLEQTVRESRWTPTARFITGDESTGQLSSRPRPNHPSSPQQSIPKPVPQITYNEMRLPTEDEQRQFVVIGNILPIGMLEVEGVSKPVYDAYPFQAAGILGVPDYSPTLESRYYIQFTIERVAIKPCYDTRHGIIIFKSDRGTIFVNEYDYPHTTSVEVYRDVMRTRWARRDNVIRFLERNSIPVPSLYPKKKLRRKYKEMPKIKEEKFYAGNKEFIC